MQRAPLPALRTILRASLEWRVTLALSTRGLDKSFGSLVVAKDVTMQLPPGERYALIGPTAPEDDLDQSDHGHAQA